MMKKNLLNKHVVKAISLGLSAVMLTTPMQAMAAEEDDTTPADPAEVDVKEDSKYETAEDLVEDAQDSTTDASDAAGVEELEDVTTTVDEETVDYTDVANDETTANNELTDAEAGLIQTDAKEAAAEEDIAAANKITEEIEDNNAVITDASKEASDAADKAAEAAEEAANATTKEEAQVAIDKAAQAVAVAEAAQEEAQAAYDENVDKLAEAENELASAKANLDAAKNSLAATKEDVAAAEAAVVAAEEKAAALKAEVDASAEELASTKDARLKAAYEKMKTTAAAANLKDYNVYTKIDAGADADNNGVDDDYTREFGKESASMDFWNDSLEYFKLYIQYVYGDDATYAWTKTGPNYAKENVYAVTYTEMNEDGVEVEITKYFNYHLADTTGEISIYEKQIGTEILIHTTTETSSEDALSIENINEDGSVTYTKYDDVKKDTDIVISTSKDEDDNDTSILVKDDNSKQTGNVDDLAEYQKSLGKNQNAEVTGETETIYEIGEITIVDSYEQKKEKEKSVSTFKNENDFKNQVDSAVAEGKVVEISWKGLFGTHTIDASDVNWFTIMADDVAELIDCGLKIEVFNMVDDTSRPKDTHTEQGIIAKTIANVTTTTNNQDTKDGYFGSYEKVGKKRKWVSAEEKARSAAKAQKAQLEAAGYSNVKYQVHEAGLFDGHDGVYYTITYSSSSTESKTIKTESYTATAYGMNTITTENVIETQEEVKYWQERKDTTNDQKIKDAIEGVEKLLNDMKAKQDAAEKALKAAQEAKKDVDAAKEELDKLSVDDTAYQAALAKYNNAKEAFTSAKDFLDEIKDDVEKAKKDYEDAADELDRFNPTGGGDGTDPTPDTTPDPTVVPLATPVAVPTVVAPVTLAAGVAQAVVAIDDEATPLAGGIRAAEPEAADEKEEAVVAIEDEDTPLAAALPSAEEKANMSWWWLLIIAILGATGYKMYKDHQKKKEEATQEA